jgi:hypothetical protein
MRYLFVVILLFSSCSIHTINFSNVFYEGAVVWEDYKFFDSIEHIMWWVHNNIEYTSDGLLDDWKSADRSNIERKGDCEDTSILMLKLVKENFGLEGKLLANYSYNHAYIEIEGIMYDPTVDIKLYSNKYTVHNPYTNRELFTFITSTHRVVEHYKEKRSYAPDKEGNLTEYYMKWYDETSEIVVYEYSELEEMDLL